MIKHVSKTKTLLRKIYVPAINCMRLKRKHIIRRWKRLKTHYGDINSIKFLEEREKLLIYGNRALFCENISNIYGKEYIIRGLENYKEGVEYIVVEESNQCEYLQALLEHSCHKASYSVRKLSKVQELLDTNGSCYILAGDDNEAEYLRTIFDAGRVISPNNSMWIGDIGKQYLDVFEAQENEVVIDAGAFDGTTEALFLEWGNGKVSKIIAFELDKNNAKVCQEYYEDNNISCVELIIKGTGRTSAKISLSDSSEGTSGSHVGEGTTEGYITSIDEAVGNQTITFIKMDVEGAELDSLIGAESTIKKNKPRLAICIYHKNEDMYDIANYILSIVPEYRLTVRHYTSCEWETVLYAEV